MKNMNKLERIVSAAFFTCGVLMYLFYRWWLTG